ncbi:Vacuolar protein sorting-associated protein vps5 [Malassezia cuniculi]|uniref:Vacuolar protein sorting-associated protein vps5 n=1 Tax=Malassezia cuniculi TaxID=948313 RepID=A0AAF0EQP7_9BASI|nr:Vacuolar protein sorting-associated protein vps5 [Malassezia cuniculi]
MRLIVTGASGLLGRAVVAEARQRGYEVKPVAFSRAQGMERVDLTDREAVARLVADYKPDAVIHTAAERRPDAVERDPQGAHALNVEAPAALAAACAALGRPAYLLALSTDYVFDGTSPPYRVDAATNPLNAYGTSKADAEKAVAESAVSGRASCVRVPVLYGATEYDNESAVNCLLNAIRNSDKKCLMDACAVRYPTCVEDVAKALLSLCVISQERDMPAIIHFSATEAMTKYDMCLVLARVWNSVAGHEIVSVDHLEPVYDTPPGSTPRPGHCKLDISQTVALGVDVSCVPFDEWWRKYLATRDDLLHEQEPEPAAEPEPPAQDTVDAEAQAQVAEEDPNSNSEEQSTVQDKDLADTTADDTPDEPQSSEVVSDDESRYGAATPTKPLPPEPALEFEMSVSDPQKVSDALGGHVVYRVRTRSNAPWLRRADTSVLRRYSDFRWLHAALVENNPGVIVPPIPEKVKLGRFAPELVEFRRRALELAITKIVNHRVLQKDEDLHMFLQSADLASDIHARDLIKGPVVTPEHRSYFGWSQSFQSHRFQETDEWFNQQVEYLGTLENILREFVSAVMTLSHRRLEHAAALKNLSRTLAVLSGSTLSRSVSTCFAALAEAEKHQHDAQSALAAHEANLLSVAFYEYERLTGSVRKAFATRVDTWKAWQRAEDELRRHKGTDGHLDVQMQQRYGISLRAAALRTRFDEVTRMCKTEMERFETEKVADLRRALAAYIEMLQKTQDNLIDEWDHCATIIKRQMPTAN